MQVAELCYSVTEAAEALGVSRKHMYNIIHMKGFPVLKVGSRQLIPKELLVQWVKDQARQN